jgi:hypothetical protein
MAKDQLSRLVLLLADDKFNNTIPVVLGNSLLFDMLQDYLESKGESRKYNKRLLAIIDFI